MSFSLIVKLQEKRRQKAEAYIPPDAAPRAPTGEAPRAPPRAAFTAPRPATRAIVASSSVGTSSTSTSAFATKMRSVRGGRVGGVSTAGTGRKKKAQKYARLKSYFTASGNV